MGKRVLYEEGGKGMDLLNCWFRSLRRDRFHGLALAIAVTVSRGGVRAGFTPFYLGRLSGRVGCAR